MKKVLINGADGKMGIMIAEIMRSNPQYGLEIAGLRTINKETFSEFDMIVDFSTPEGAEEMYDLALKRKKPFLTGTTGLSNNLIKKMEKEKQIPLFFSANMSLGVYYFGEVLKLAAKEYKNYNISMHEEHHVHKKDAPSGTAKTLAKLIDFSADKVTCKREGSIVGVHEVSFFSDYEEITLKHKAKDRKLFAESAVIIAAWLVSKPAGFYTMKDYAG